MAQSGAAVRPTTAVSAVALPLGAVFLTVGNIAGRSNGEPKPKRATRPPSMGAPDPSNGAQGRAMGRGQGGVGGGSGRGGGGKENANPVAARRTKKDPAPSLALAQSSE